MNGRSIEELQATARKIERLSDKEKQTLNSPIDELADSKETEKAGGKK